ncbi:MAG: hypothetical protein ACK2T6_08715 [Anaerolineae bacterium]
MTRQASVCRDAIALVAGWETAADPAQLRAAREHVAACPLCRARFERLATAVASGRDDEITCAECEERLAGYLAAERAGQEAPTVMPEVAGHLSACSECRDLLAQLGDVMTALAAGELPEPASAPRFDITDVSRPTVIGARAHPEIATSPLAAASVVATRWSAVARTRALDLARRAAGLGRPSGAPATGGTPPLDADSLEGPWRTGRKRMRSRGASRAGRPDAMRGGELDTGRGGTLLVGTWLRRLSPVASTGALITLAAVLGVALLITWRSMQTAAPEPLPDATAAAATLDAALLSLTATASAAIEERTPPATADEGVRPALRPTASAGTSTGAPTETATASPAPSEHRRDDDRRDRGSGGDDGAASPDERTAMPIVTTVPGVEVETAYPPPPTLAPPTSGYPPPPTRWRPPAPSPTAEAPPPTAES